MSVVILPHPTAQLAFEWGDYTWSTSSNLSSPFAEPPSNWDYSTAISIGVQVAWDPNEVRSFALRTLEVVLTVDCPATAMRWVSAATLASGTQHQSVVVEVPPGEASGTLEVRAWVVCSPGDPNAGLPPAAKLAWKPRQRLYLEGDGSRFPTQAIPFSQRGLPPDAAWTVEVEVNDLDDSFGSCVQALINADHPVRELLLDLSRPGAATAVQVLRRDIITTVLDQVARDSTLEQTFDPEFTDSVGSVLENWCRLYLKQDLPSTLAMVRDDPRVFDVELQAGLRFLEKAQ
ncbi:hypothetical protein B0O41_0310 [Propionibacteriaceae bacterium ES.041]|uniref:hypothetical protein n=1 Tax=Enemella evansiae TaxID=2016499 RepID=UPI000B96B764|nr:hypothetical protein [Enemella evansiae]OYO06750.1 hypothetical protein CGZ95_00220 [Enemella evansiae]PFG65545.1 hypothetical protein B0O41_0310 [Propionibacteriaceae bacterium ES.041]